MSEQIEIKRALVSVYDKTGLDELVGGLVAAGVELVSTGGSAALIESLGLPVTKVEDLTGFPECLDGRVKTLHPRVHAGILADRRLPEHVAQLEELGVAPFDLVVVNLYPFTDTVMSGASVQECIEKIDIGGPSMVRAAAKNHASVAIVTDGDAAGVGVLDDRDARGAEVVRGTQCGIGVDVVVVAHLLAVQLLGRGQATRVGRVDVQRRALVRVLAVAQHCGPVPGGADPRRPAGPR